MLLPSIFARLVILCRWFFPFDHWTPCNWKNSHDRILLPRSSLWHTILMYFPATLFNALSIVTAAIYFCSASLIAFNIIRNQSIENPRAWFLTSAVIAIVLHLLLVTYSISINRAIPNDLFNMLSLVFLVISVLFCFSAISQSIETLALIVFPFSAVAVLLNVGNQAMLGATNTYESAPVSYTHLTLPTTPYV